MAFENGIGSLFWMSQEISNFIVSLKAGLRPKESLWFGQLLGEKYVECSPFSEAGEEISSIPEVCFPPSSKKLDRADHAELLAQGVAQILGSPTPTNLFRHSEAQSEQSQKTKKRHDRRELSLQLISPDVALGHRFILVDDVVTTGATLLAMERALTQAGGEVIAKLTLAQTPLRSALPRK